MKKYQRVWIVSISILLYGTIILAQENAPKEKNAPDIQHLREHRRIQFDDIIPFLLSFFEMVKSGGIPEGQSLLEEAMSSRTTSGFEGLFIPTEYKFITEMACESYEFLYFYADGVVLSTSVCVPLSGFDDTGIPLWTLPQNVQSRLAIGSYTLSNHDIHFQTVQLTHPDLKKTYHGSYRGAPSILTAEVYNHSTGHHISQHTWYPQDRNFWRDTGYVFIRGRIQNPGQYVHRPGETIPELVQRAGGWTEYAITERFTVTRDNADNKTTTRMKVTRGEDFTLLPNDVVDIHRA